MSARAEDIWKEFVDKLTDDGALQLACDDGKTEIVLNGTGLKSLISEVAKYEVFPLD